MRTPKIYSFHLKYNGHIQGLPERLEQAQRDIAHLPPCSCGCNVGMVENGKYRCMMCNSLLIG